MIKLWAFLAAPLMIVVLASASHAATLLHHVHGLAFTPDGEALLVPAHIGLAVYRDGKWSRSPGPAHDLMGFSVAKNAIYSSGHPALNTPLRDPLGLVRSTDGGKSWQHLGLAGEADFHLMAAGYGSNAIYVFNPQPNSRMPQAGIHVTRDEGRSWTRSSAAGLTGQLITLAAHPTSADTLAVGTVRGLHVSRDSGTTFRRVGPGAAVTAVTFDYDGKHLYFTTDKLEGLHRIDLDGRPESIIPLPELDRDFVLYIAQNPAHRQAMAIATRKRDVHLSSDAGKSWQQLAREGEPVAPSRQARGR